MAQRYATVQRCTRRETVEVIERQYLPATYRVIDQDRETVAIAGEDFAGWTLNGYVIPRLASGLIIATELSAEEYDAQ